MWQNVNYWSLCYFQLYVSKCSYIKFEKNNTVFISVFMVHNIPLQGKKKRTFSSGRHKKAKKT